MDVQTIPGRRHVILYPNARTGHDTIEFDPKDKIQVDVTTKWWNEIFAKNPHFIQAKKMPGGEMRIVTGPDRLKFDPKAEATKIVPHNVGG